MRYISGSRPEFHSEHCELLNDSRIPENYTISTSAAESGRKCETNKLVLMCSRYIFDERALEAQTNL